MTETIAGFVISLIGTVYAWYVKRSENKSENKLNGPNTRSSILITIGLFLSLWGGLKAVNEKQAATIKADSLSSAYTRDHFTIKVKEDSLRDLQNEFLNYLTGKNSFCFMKMFLLRERGVYNLIFQLANVGKNPLHNIRIEVINITKLNERLNYLSIQRNAMFSRYKVGDTVDTKKEEMFEVGPNDYDPECSFNLDFILPVERVDSGSTTTISGYRNLGHRLFPEKNLRSIICFNVNYYLSTGSYTQKVKFRNSNWNGKSYMHDEWSFASRIEPNKMKFDSTMIDIGYLREPLEKDSDIQWTSTTHF